MLKCGFSTFCLLTPTASYNSETMEAALLQWASILGMPRVLVTDGGSHFNNAVISGVYYSYCGIFIPQ